MFTDLLAHVPMHSLANIPISFSNSPHSSVSSSFLCVSSFFYRSIFMLIQLPTISVKFLNCLESCNITKHMHTQTNLHGHILDFILTCLGLGGSYRILPWCTVSSISSVPLHLSQTQSPFGGIQR